MSARKGQLKVTMPALESAIRPTVNVIDATSLALVKTALRDEQVSVPVGTYLLTAMLPSGERSLGLTRITSGRIHEVELAADAGEVESAPPEPSRTLETLGPAQVEHPSRIELASRPWFLRYLTVHRNRVTPATAITTVEQVSEDGRSVDLIVRVTKPNRVYFAQLVVPGQVPFNVALPVMRATLFRTCRLSVEVGEQLSALVSLPANPVADAIARYLQSGNLPNAAIIGAEAEGLLRHKRLDAFGAALGGYALLRLADLERLHDWPANLARWFQWLPDGAIIAGEQAALSADHKTAVEYFCAAARRGLPVFTDGFSLLASRLREYGQADQRAPDVPKRLHAEATRHANRLTPLSPLVDFTRITLAFPARRLDNPARTQTPLQRPSASQGWRRFSPTSGRFERQARSS
jgi:hypothetical protein